MNSDLSILQRYDSTRDPEAFTALVSRHGAMVYAVAVRITRNAADADDITQECFLELSRKANSVRTSVAAWLHLTATHRAQNLNRQRAAQRRVAAESQGQTVNLEAGAWKEIAPHLDEVLSELPDEQRIPLIGHYLEERSQSDLANELGVSQPTISRRLEEGLTALRARLEKRGIAPGLPLGSLMAGCCLSLPPGLKLGLMKIGLAGMGAPVATTSAAAGTVAKAKAASMLLPFLATSAVLGVAVLATSMLMRPATTKPPPTTTPPLLGATGFLPSSERPVGWRGDWTGKFTGATPPTQWSRRVKGSTTALRYQANKPKGEPTDDSRQLEYFTIKDWLVAGPYSVPDAVADIDRDHLGGEATLEPEENQPAGTSQWKFLRADVDTQSRHDHNEGTCGQSYIDFVYAFGKLTPTGRSVNVEGDFGNKVAYAHTYIYSPSVTTLQLRIPFTGTAGRYWLNGQPGTLERGFNKTVTLIKGWNRLLLKISAAEGVGKDYTGRWLSQWLVAAYLTPILPVSYETQNIKWMTRMTGRSMSQPIVVGDRVFVGSDISDLMCIARNDGRILWLRSTTPYDALSEDERSALPNAKEAIDLLRSKLNTATTCAVEHINAAVFSSEGLSSAQELEFEKTLKEKHDIEKRIHTTLAGIDRKRFPSFTGNQVSSSNATPCSDGERVYWVCGGGMKGPGAYAIVCFDLDGNRLWTRHEVLGSQEHGNHQSPALIDGKLIYGANNTLLALDAKSGDVLWRNTNVGNMGSGTSPVVARIGGKAIVITARKIIRVSDGVDISGSKLATDISDMTPVVEDGVIYSSSQFKNWSETFSIIAVGLPPTAEAGANAKVLWAPPGKDVHTPVRGANFVVASPLFFNKILYGVDIGGGMFAVDMAEHRSLYRRWLDGYNRFNRYVYGVTASPALAGKYIYVTDDAGYTHLIEPGPEFKEAGKNVIENIFAAGSGGNPCKQESFYTSPYFDGNTMFLRGEEYLYCIEEKQVK